jgi:hypothetical protein
VLEEIQVPGSDRPCTVLRRREKGIIGQIVISREEVFDCIDEWHQSNGHMGQERILGHCKEKYFNITLQEIIKYYYKMCPVCMKKNPVTQPARGSRKPIRSLHFRDRFQIDLIDFCKLRKRDLFGVFMCWVLVIKDHATGVVYLCALPTKHPNLVAYKMHEIFGIIGFPKIFHTDNGKEFAAKVVLKFLCQMNSNIISVTGRPHHPSDQGLVEGMNKLVKRIIGSILMEQRLVGDNPNWTEVLGLVAAEINSQHERGKDDFSFFKAAYGQQFDHKVSCSKEEARRCWTLPQQLLKVTNNTEFSNYVSANYYLIDDSAADDEDDDGYFSDETLPEDERDDVTDEDFLKHLVTPDSSGVNDRKRPHNEDLMNHRSEYNQSLEDNDRRCWRKVNFDESNKSPENHPMGVNKRKSPPESLHDNATLVNHFVDSTLCNDTEIKDKEGPHKVAASTPIAPNFSHNKEEFNDPWDDTWVRDTAISELKQSVNIGSCSIAEA